jgi:hypothetical protein
MMESEMEITRRKRGPAKGTPKPLYNRYGRKHIDGYIIKKGTCPECGIEPIELYRFKGRDICRYCLNPETPIDIEDYLHHESSLAEMQAIAPGFIGRLIRRGSRKGFTREELERGKTCG